MHLNDDGKCKYDGSSEAKNYLFGVARNLFKQELKSEKSKPFNRNQVQVDGILLVKQSAQACPLEALETAESHHILRKAIAELPPKSQQAIKLVYLKGKTRQAAAKDLGCDYITIYLRIQYGLKKLAEMFHGNT